MSEIRNKYVNSSALQYYLESLHITWTEALCFGIGEGLDFQYINYENDKRILVHKEDLFLCFCENMYFDLKTICLVGEGKNCLKLVKNMLKHNCTVPILFYDKETSRKRIKFLSRILSDKEIEVFDVYSQQFIKYKIGEENNLLNDSELLHRIPLAYIIYPRVELLNIEHMVVCAIKDNAEKMLHPSKLSRGIQGMETCLCDWEKQDKIDIYFQKNNWFEIETGLLREFYADFLKEAYEITKLETIKHLETGYRELAFRWKCVISHDGILPNQNRNTILREIIEMERKLCEEASNLKMNCCEKSG